MVPSDLKPLPSFPFGERPLGLPLNVEEVRTALWLEHGNVTNAAIRLRTTSSRLRAYVNGSPRLQMEIREAREQLVDKAESVVRESLHDENDPARRDTMARWVLDRIGKERGFGQSQNPVNIRNVGPLQIVWGDGSYLNSDNAVEGEKVIKGEKVIEDVD